MSDLTRDINEAKFLLALDYEGDVKAVFNYTNECGETRDRRLVPDEFDGEVIGGQSFNENGIPEGYRQFRLDRINGPVTLR